MVLLALANASRVSEIHALDIRYLRQDESGVTFTLAELTKTAQPGKQKAVHYFPLKQDCRLCPITTLEEYINRTSPIRKKETKLLLSVVKPSSQCPNLPLLGG